MAEMEKMISGKMNLQMFADSDPPPPARGSGGGGYSAEYVQELRNEAAAWRTKLRAAEEEVTKLKAQTEEANKKVAGLEGQNKTFLENVCKVLGLEADKTKPEDIAGKITEAISGNNATTEKAQEALKKAAFMASAVKAGVRKEALDDAYKLADFSAVKVDFETMSVFPVDKDGKQVVDKDSKPVTGLDALAGELVKEKPWLAGKAGGVGGPSNPGGGGAPPGEPEGFGAKLGKQQAEVAKKHIESQSHYFGK